MSIDLRNAKPGDKLITKHGNTMVYIAYYPGTCYPHTVLYSNGSIGTRLDDGHVSETNRLWCDEDIIEIVPFTRTRFELLSVKVFSYVGDLCFKEFLFENGWSFTEFQKEFDESVGAGAAREEDVLKGGC